MELKELTHDAIMYIFNHYDVDLMSPWEVSFMESIQDQYARKKDLSDRQKEILGQIWDKQK